MILDQLNIINKWAFLRAGARKMEESKKAAIREASEEVSHEFKTLINTQDLDSLKQLQLLMYVSPISFFRIQSCFEIV